MLDQKRSVPGKEKLQKTQNYSWLIESDKQTPFSKANKSQIAEVLLSPPDPPWAFAIADSGQKHLVYRAPVNYESPYVVQLELEQVVYTTSQLRTRLSLAKRVVSVVGHKGAANPSVTLAIVAGTDTTERWFEVFNEPLTRLALYVCPSKDVCENEIART